MTSSQINYTNILGVFLPNIYAKSVTIEDYRVVLVFAIKEKFNSLNTLSFSSYDFLKKHVNIVVEQVTDIIPINQSPNSTKNINIKDDTGQISLDEFNNREIIFQTSFDIELKNIRELSYIFRSSLVGISETFGINTDSFSAVAKETTEVVLVEGNFQNNLYTYFTSDNEPWRGDISTTEIDNETVFYTKEGQGTPGRKLTEVITFNTRSKDFRSVSTNKFIAAPTPREQFVKDDALKQRSLEEQSILVSSFNKKVLQDLSNNAEIVSDYFTIMNSDRNKLTYLFSINFENLIKQKCMYRQFVNDENINSIINLTNIIRCELYRKQVLNKKSVVNSINNSEIRKLINKDSEEVRIIDNNYKKTFTISDNEISNIIDGQYEYSLEIEFTDGVVEYLKNHLDTLISLKNNLLEYNSFCNNIAYYDLIKDSLNNTELIAHYERLQILNIINTYLDILCGINNYDGSTRTEQLNILTTFVKPVSANPKSVKFFLDIYNNLISMLSRTSSINPAASDISSVSTGMGGYNRILIEKTFKENIDLSINDKVTLEFLNIRSSTITDKSFKQLIRDEKEYFNLKNENLYPEEINYQFISPFSVKINNDINIIKKSNNNRGILEYTFESKDKLSAILTEAKLISSKKDKYRFSIPKASTAIDPSASKNEDTQQIKINNFLNTLKLLEHQGITIQNDLLTTQNTNSERNLQSSNTTMRSQNLVYDCIDSLKRIINTKTRYQISAITTPADAPNQIKQSQTIRNLDFNEDINIIKYRLLMKIEYLFEEKDSNENAVWSWGIFSLAKFNEQMRTRTTPNLLMRLTPHNYEYSENLIYNDLDFKFNRYFILNFG